MVLKKFVFSFINFYGVLIYWTALRPNLFKLQIYIVAFLVINTVRLTFLLACSLRFMQPF
jgi:hypothetical protein